MAQDNKNAVSSMLPPTEETTATSKPPPPLPTIPFDLVVEILCRLPVKSLLQLRCVCKSWKTLISDPEFAKTHLRCSPKDFTCHHTMANLRSYRSRALMVYPLQSVFNAAAVTTPATATRVKYPLNDQNRFNFIAGSCHGMLLLDIDESSPILWNPSTRRFKKLPSLENPLLEEEDCECYTTYGFGYDHSTDRYKVVAVFCLKCDDDDDDEVYRHLEKDNRTMGMNSNRVEHFDCCHETAIKIQPETPMNIIHQVRLPPKRTTLLKLRQRLSEIFFPDDPLHRFKNQTWLMKLLLGIQYFFPIFQWGPQYSLALLRSDLISGLTIASLAIPQGISYAKLANLPPIIGLYSSFVPPLVYSLLGSSKHLGVGPVSIASLVMGSMLSETVSFTQDPILYLQLAFTATFIAGLFQASLGILRLGFLIDFLSKATLVGFMAGAAIIVSLQQLKGLLGIVHFTTKMQIVPVLVSVYKEKDEWSWQTILLGFGFLAFLLTTRHISMKKPKLFWVSAAAPLTSVILSTILVFLLRHKTHHIAVIGYLPKGLNPPSPNMLYFNGPYLALAIKTGIVTGILSLTEGIAVGRTFASLKNYQVDGNKEMMAIGIMNIAGSCSSCYVTTGSFSRSAVNYNAGAQTAVSNIIMAAAVLVTLLFLIPLFYYTPNVVLAAIIITAVIGLIDYQAALKLWKVDKLDFLACLCSFLGVLFISVPLGLGIAVVISVFKILLHVSRPNTVVLGNIPGTQIFYNINQYKEALRVPSFLILAVESPIYFANSTYLQERILRWVREEEELIKANNGESLKCIILDMTAVTAIDTSGLETLGELRKMLDKRSLQLVLANPVGNVMEKLHGSKVLDSFGVKGVYLTVGEAVADISSLEKAQP